MKPARNLAGFPKEMLSQYNLSLFILEILEQIRFVSYLDKKWMLI